VEARAIAERRVRQLADVPAPARKRRLTAYLLRRGWSGGTVRSLVEELCSSDPAGAAQVPERGIRNAERGTER
jgi:SOS response regulatory protein OraA/RecX